MCVCETVLIYFPISLFPHAYNIVNIIHGVGYIHYYLKEKLYMINLCCVFSLLLHLEHQEEFYLGKGHFLNQRLCQASVHNCDFRFILKIHRS